MHWYLEALRKYAVFSGRARRREYWFFTLFNFLVAIGLSMIDVMRSGGTAEVSLLASIYSLAVLLPSLAVAVRRLHDVGRSGWWILIAFVPLIGLLVLLVFTLQDSQPHPNEYGPSPKPAFGDADPYAAI